MGTTKRHVVQYTTDWIHKFEWKMHLSWRECLQKKAKVMKMSVWFRSKNSFCQVRLFVWCQSSVLIRWAIKRLVGCLITTNWRNIKKTTVYMVPTNGTYLPTGGDTPHEFFLTTQGMRDNQLSVWKPKFFNVLAAGHIVLFPTSQDVKVCLFSCSGSLFAPGAECPLLAILARHWMPSSANVFGDVIILLSQGVLVCLS